MQALAFAKAGHAAPELFDALGETAVKHSRDFHPAALANTVLAYVTAGRNSPEVQCPSSSFHLLANKARVLQ